MERRRRTLRFTLAYDGTRLVGWQRQAEGVSVQGLLEAALASFEGGPVVVHGAGRTDAGVHALGQVASVALTCGADAETLVRGLNATLPDDVRVIAAMETDGAFHARFDSRAKTYRYVIRNAPQVSPFEAKYVWHLREPLDVEAMRRAASLFEGRHDFAAFRSTGSPVTTSVRTLFRSEVLTGDRSSRFGIYPLAPEGLLAYEVRGDGFLRHMVRAIVGTLVDVGSGRRPVDGITRLFDTGTRADAGATAPARGLYLVTVDYD